VALDYNAPVLTLAAMHVLDDSNDPYFTRLKPGEYAKVKPKGKPCDAAFKCGPSKLSQAGKIAIIVTTVIMGLIILGLVGWYVGVMMKKKNAKPVS
jgi:endoglucanase